MTTPAKGREIKERIVQELKKREEFFRNLPYDPYDINNAVMAALAEVRFAIEDATKDHPERKDEK